MITVEVGLRGPADPFGGREGVEELLDRTMNHLLACDVIDPGVSESHLPDGQVLMEFHFMVERGTPDEAVSDSMA